MGIETGMTAGLLLAGQILLIGLAVTTISLFGWATSSLHVLAGWTTDLATRLEIIRGVLCSIAAGAIAAIACWYFKLPIPLCVLCVFLAGMSGDKFLKPLAERVIARAAAALDALIGNNNGGKS